MAKLGHHLEDLAIDKSGGLWINGNGGGAARFQLRNGDIAGFTTPRLSSNEVAVSYTHLQHDGKAHRASRY